MRPINRQVMASIVACLAVPAFAEPLATECGIPGIDFDKNLSVPIPRQCLNSRMQFASSAERRRPDEAMGRLTNVALSGSGEVAGSPKQGAANRSPDKRTTNGLEEVVVTAQRRSEQVQDVPISIAVLEGGDLDRGSQQGVMDALVKVPGVGMFQGFQSGAAQLSIRGVTAMSLISSGANPIAYYLDSVPFAFVRSAITPDASAYDLQQVEVLRGPQGTLYGATAQNGVVRVLTNDADVDSFEFKARTAGSLTDDGGENYRGDMAINVPVIEGKLAARAVVGYQSLSGWIDKPNDSDANDGELKNFRLKINASISDKLSMGATAWRSQEKYGAPSSGNDDRTHRSTTPEPIETEYDVLGYKIRYDSENFVVTGSSSYIDYHLNSEMDTNLIASGSNILTTNLAAKVRSQESM